MNANELFNPGPSSGDIPEGDPARQAIHSLRGYVYQALATALAWVDIGKHDKLFLEVAEDYAVIAKQALNAVQVKDTEESGSVTLNSASVRNAVTAFVDLVERNPSFQVNFHFWTTSEIGTERDAADRPAGVAGLKYWRKAATGADLSHLRTILESDKFPKSVREFSKNRDDTALRSDLIKRIDWDCGKPDVSILRQELEERLVVLGHDQFKFPAEEAWRVADTLVYEVLKKSIIKGTQNRVLTCADLYTAIYAATRISLPRSAVDDFARSLPVIARSLAAGMAPGNPLSISETDWLIHGSTLPTPQGMITRVAVEATVSDALRDFGAVVLVGSSGLGKSTVSRAVAVAHAGAFFMVGFRGHDANEARHRLDMLFGLIGGLPSGALILEDLSCINDTSVALSLARVIKSLRRRDRYMLITCYQKPSQKTLNDIGFNQGCVVDCPYFLEEEVQALISENKGDTDKWGHVAYTVGRGHPQLTHAFVSGMAARGWPIQEITDIIDQGLSSDDTDDARNAARRSLIAQFSEGTRNLLYRLSLVSGQFDRSLALDISEIPPQISQPGECIDRLVGPWLETAGSDLFRVSPLVQNSGSKMLSTDEQQRIHESIAVQMLSKETLYTSEVDQIMVHALLGKSTESLIMLALGILSTDTRTCEMLAEHSLFLYILTDRPIYREDPRASGILRIAQFKLAAAAGETDNISNIATALFREISVIAEDEVRDNLEAMALIAVLSTIGIANHLDNWINLLLRCIDMVESNESLQYLIENVQGTNNTHGSKLFNGLFFIGSVNLASVDRLEYIINELDEVEVSSRTILLTPVDKMFSNYYDFINAPSWINQQRSKDFDVAGAAIRYQKMAKKTQSWGIPQISHQCSAAQAVLLDEYEDNKESALAVLEEAETVMGNDLILDRAKARIYWRHGEYRMVVNIFRNIADQVDEDNPFRRKSALREAAISAAKCGDWLQAEQWFLDAQSAARSAQDDDMDIMAIGLGADSAVTALEAGEVARALKRLAEALSALADVDPEETLFAAYCHRVIRHTAVWVQSRVRENGLNLDGETIRMEAGACSNPEPSPAIREIPLTHIDVAWYTLAGAEIEAGLEAGISAALHDQLVQGPIPLLETGLRKQMIQIDIDENAATKFASHFAAYIEAVSYMSRISEELEVASNPIAPKRGHIPTLDKHAPFEPVAEQVAKQVIMAYGICGTLANRPDAMTELETALNNQFTGPFPGKPVFDHWNEESVLPDELGQAVANIINVASSSKSRRTTNFLVGGFAFFRVDQQEIRFQAFPYRPSRLLAEVRLDANTVYKEVSPFQTSANRTPH